MASVAPRLWLGSEDESAAALHRGIGDGGAIPNTASVVMLLQIVKKMTPNMTGGKQPTHSVLLAHHRHIVVPLPHGPLSEI